MELLWAGNWCLCGVKRFGEKSMFSQLIMWEKLVALVFVSLENIKGRTKVVSGRNIRLFQKIEASSTGV